MKILVGGAGSGSGKTTFIRLILKIFPDRFTVVKISISEKYPCEKVTDRSVLNVPGKDTYYFLNGGAKSVLWVRGKRRCIGNTIKAAASEIEGDAIFEGNSSAYFIKGDLSFFVSKGKEELKKESAAYFANHADYLVENAFCDIEPSFSGPVLRLNIMKEFEDPSRAIKDIMRNLLNFA